MRAFLSSHRAVFTRVCALIAAFVVATVVALGTGCENETGEGVRCNALVLQDECKPGSHCRRSDS